MPPNDPPEFWSDRNNVYFRCVEDSNEPIMICDRRGHLSYVNPAWCRTYGYSSQEAIGQTPRLLRSRHQDRDFYSAMWLQILDPKIGRWKGKLVNQGKDGREVPVLLSITPYRDLDTGEILGYMGVALDLSEIEALKEQVTQQEKLITIGELTSGLAHEVGTPIGVIRGRAEMLLMEMGSHPSVAKTLDIIIRQADRVSTLINTLLRFSRSGGSLEMLPVRLQEVVTEVSELLSEKIRKRHIEWICSVDPHVVVLGDANKIEQVLINLLMNSIQAIDERVEKGFSGPRQLKLAAQQEKGRVVIDVSDTGTGISASVAAKIFDPFFTTKPAGKGTGLGLSIVWRLVHEMDGQVELIPKDPPGAQFRVTLKPGSLS